MAGSHDHDIRVTYRDTDQMGVVYYANYFVYMETGRVELLRARNWSYRDMEAEGLRIPVLHASCNYESPALYDDIVRIRTEMTKLTRVRLEFRYELFCDARGERLATGETHHVFFDLQNRVTRAPRNIIARIEGRSAV